MIPLFRGRLDAVRPINARVNGFLRNSDALVRNTVGSCEAAWVPLALPPARNEIVVRFGSLHQSHNGDPGRAPPVLV